MDDDDDLTSVYTVNNPTEAEIVRNALQSIGIACQIGGESQAGLAGVLEIDVLVHASDVDAARKHLRELKREKIARKKKRAEARKARAKDVSEAIQEMPPPPRSSDAIQEKPPKKPKN
jgi:hypothetical protein